MRTAAGVYPEADQEKLLIQFHLPVEDIMRLNEDDIVASQGPGGEGPADAGAGGPADPAEHDGGADGGAETEGPQDAGAGDSVDTDEHDGGADGGA